MDFKLFAVILIIATAVDCSPSLRSRRDLSCSAGGHRLCKWMCMGSGWADGSCVWDTTTGAFDCTCSREKRGVRCHLGGSNVCHLSCMAIGHEVGDCDGDYNCKCSGRNRWGNIIEDVKNRL